MKIRSEIAYFVSFSTFKQSVARFQINVLVFPLLDCAYFPCVSQKTVDLIVSEQLFKQWTLVCAPQQVDDGAEASFVALVRSLILERQTLSQLLQVQADAGRLLWLNINTMYRLLWFSASTVPSIIHINGNNLQIQSFRQDGGVLTRTGLAGTQVCSGTSTGGAGLLDVAGSCCWEAFPASLSVVTTC